MREEFRLEPAQVPGAQFVDMPARLRAAAAAHPLEIAVIDGAARLRWGDFVDTIDRIAAELAERGLRRGDVVASLAGVSADHLLLYMGVLAAGACMAPLPVGAHPDALRAMLADSGAALVFADAANRAVLAGLGAPADRLEELRPAAARRAPAAPVSPAETDLFDIIYSSGTTGTPKGIQHDCRFRDRQMARLSGYGFRPGAVSLVSTPLYSNTTLAALLPALAYGGTVVLMRKFDARGFLELAEAHRVTHAMLVPVQYRRLLAHPEFDRFELSAFEVKLSTSAPLPEPVIRDALKRWPGRLVNIYGMTEGGVSVILDCTEHPDKLDTVGTPAAGGELRIIDEEGRELPQGETGEIVGRSGAIMVGYRNAPEKTREATWTSPEGHTFIRTGDMGRLDEDGFLTLLDRRKDMIISGGFNIFAADLELVLCGHPEVHEAAVIGVPSERWGETPLALVVREPGAAVAAEELRDWANARLGKLQRLSAVEFRDSLPRSDIGKVLKRELREPYLKQAQEA
ncbi:class I adenylate-forming enzyme family protein [Acidimangrovimonas pyrenivorans]|uniref:Class I adenylate-forming enzyme family protein n=1 Tax=Acidimangrovimonas pyrenivorans TaxID=2030798 RepID=A0ABV7AEP9_9RHOB